MAGVKDGVNRGGAPRGNRNAVKSGTRTAAMLRLRLVFE